MRSSRKVVTPLHILVSLRWLHKVLEAQWRSRVCGKSRTWWMMTTTTDNGNRTIQIRQWKQKNQMYRYIFFLTWPIYGHLRSIRRWRCIMSLIIPSLIFLFSPASLLFNPEMVKSLIFLVAINFFALHIQKWVPLGLLFTLWTNYWYKFSKTH